MGSEIVIYDVGSKSEEVVYSTDRLIEAPNWSPCGTFLIVNGDGEIYRFELGAHGNGADRLKLIETGEDVHCNNDHGISADGKTLVISDSYARGTSCIYTLPMTGGSLKRITENTPSYWHGWSPDGSRFAYTARRDGDFNIFTIGVEGGEETQLTFGAGHADGPDYTPDGKWIWFNSDHHGSTPDLWRMKTDGSDLEQMTDDRFVNWFPHPSPDGKMVLYLAYPEDVLGHPRGQNVELKLIHFGGGGEPHEEMGDIETCASFYGGQGSINVPNWSPDSQKFAYIRYAKLT